MLAGEDTCRCRIVNLSHGGILVIAPMRAGEVLVPGRSLEIELRFDGKDSRWLRLAGRIRRVQETTIAMEFEKVSLEFIQLVDDSLGASYGRRRILSVVSVDATAGRRTPIAEAFRSAGCIVVEVSTPLEAIVRLGELEFEPDLIVIADSVPGSISGELRQFIEREHPRAKLVTVGDDLINPNEQNHWLSSADPGRDLLTRVRRLLLPVA